ncbi:MAG: type II secretion system F family protein [Candidatus Latescibacterota bacterium]
MDFQLLIPSAAIALLVVCAAIGILLFIKGQANRRLKDRLQDVILLEDDDTKGKSVILRDMDLSTIPLFNHFLQNAKWAHRLDTLLVQGDINLRLGSFILIMLIIAVLGIIAGYHFTDHILISLGIGLFLGWIPLVYAKQKKLKRVRKFEMQFPDALDMLTNALRAGMALTGAVQVVAEESPDPVAREFGILLEENRLGLDMKEALRKLGGRIDSAELRLFVTAVILQRETGGNLAEILEGTAAVIRDRFRILGDVRSMTAQAKLSGMILVVLPIVMAMIIMTIAPDYLKGLVADPIGRYLIMSAVLLQVTGYFIMRRIVNIKV